jgi:CheY-like chemotaxis protein
MTFLVLVVDDEPDVEMLFRQQFRRDLRDNRFTMDFAQSGESALQRISDAGGQSLSYRPKLVTAGIGKAAYRGGA